LPCPSQYSSRRTSYSPAERAQERKEAARDTPSRGRQYELSCSLTSKLGAAQRPAIASDRTPERRSYSRDHARLTTKSACAFTGVLRVGDRLQPSHVLTALSFLHGDMFHAMIGSRSVPMLFARRNPNGVTRTNSAHWSSPGLHPAYARGDKKRLTKRVVMPSSSCARLESNPCRPNSRGFWCLDDGILPDGSGETRRAHPA